MTSSIQVPITAEATPQNFYSLSADTIDCHPPSREPSPPRSCSGFLGFAFTYAPLCAVSIFTGEPRIRGRFQRRPYFVREIRIGCDCMACETQSGDCAMYIDDYYASLSEENSMFVAAARGVHRGYVLWKGGRVVENVGGLRMLGNVPVVRSVGEREKFVGKVRVGCDCVGCRLGLGDCVMYYYDGELSPAEGLEVGREETIWKPEEVENWSHEKMSQCESFAKLQSKDEKELEQHALKEGSTTFGEDNNGVALSGQERVRKVDSTSVLGECSGSDNRSKGNVPNGNLNNMKMVSQVKGMTQMEGDVVCGSAQFGGHAESEMSVGFKDEMNSQDTKQSEVSSVCRVRALMMPSSA